MNPQKWQPPKLGSVQSAHLDCIRSVAAWAVMWGHLRSLFFVDFQHVQKPTWLLTTIYFLTGLGHQAVMVFFVLSGFLISSTIMKSQQSGTWSWRDYAIKRATRLYVVLIPGLLFGLAWDSLGRSLPLGKLIYTHPIADLGPSIPVQNLTAGNFLGNLLYLQTILCGTFGSNAPLWSLANEFWYYVLFPLGTSAAIAWNKRRWRSAAFFIIGMAVCVFVGYGLLLGFLVWLAGFALVFAYDKLKLHSKALIATWIALSSFVLFVSLAAARIHALADAASDLSVGAAFTFFLIFLLQTGRQATNGAYSSVSHLFAGFSYSLYVLHFPLLLFLRSLFVPVERWQPGIRNFSYALLVGFAVLAFAWLVSLFTENKTSGARDLVQHLISQRKQGCQDMA